MKSPRQSEVLPIAGAIQPNKETQELMRLFYQSKKTAPVLSYKDLTDENIKLVLTTFAGMKQITKPLHTPSKIQRTSKQTKTMFLLQRGILNTATTPKTRNMLRRFMKAHYVDYVQE